MTLTVPEPILLGPLSYCILITNPSSSSPKWTCFFHSFFSSSSSSTTPTTTVPTIYLISLLFVLLTNLLFLFLTLFSIQTKIVSKSVYFSCFVYLISIGYTRSKLSSTTKLFGYVVFIPFVLSGLVFFQGRWLARKLQQQDQKPNKKGESKKEEEQIQEQEQEQKQGKVMMMQEQEQEMDLESQIRNQFVQQGIVLSTDTNPTTTTNPTWRSSMFGWTKK